MLFLRFCSHILEIYNSKLDKSIKLTWFSDFLSRNMLLGGLFLDRQICKLPSAYRVGFVLRFYEVGICLVVFSFYYFQV